MLKNTHGFVHSLYIVALVCIGALLWLFWQSGTKNYYKASIEFDTAVSGLLVANNVSDADVLSQSRREKRAGMSLWVEYEKTITIASRASLERIGTGLRGLAKAKGLSIEKTSEGGAEVFTVRREGKTLSRLVLAVRQDKKKSAGKKVALVIDDLGNQRDISKFLGLHIPINFAIMPKEPYSKQLALELTRLQIPFIMHLPLEPEKYPAVNPGAHAILTGMPDETLLKTYRDNLASVPGAIGVNNHMGSQFTANEKKMKVLLGAIKKDGLFFLDSYTTPKSVAAAVANAVGVRHLKNELFLDLEDDRAHMEERLEFLMKKVEREGSVIAIAHVHKKHIVAALQSYIPRFKEKGIAFVYLTDLLETEQ